MKARICLSQCEENLVDVNQLMRSCVNLLKEHKKRN
jgi:hypothetical protein